SGPGMRHRMLFEFARHLKAIPQLAGCTVQKLKPLVKQWHAAALPTILTQPFAESWCDFVECWGTVHYAKGEGLMTDILSRAMKEAQPAAAAQYDSEPIRLLVAICYQLHEEAGGKTFFLATRKAAEMIGVQPRDI